MPVLIWACSGAPKSADLSDVPQLTLSATHAITVPSPVKALALSSNDAASWLGLIAMITDAGELIVTNVEGDNPRYLGSGRYTDVVGMESIGLPATFFALDEAGRIRPFVESDNESNFKAAPISVDAAPLAKLCSVTGDTSLMGITKDGKLLQFSINLKDGISLTPIETDRQVNGRVIDCAADRNGDVFTLSRDGDTLTLSGEMKAFSFTASPIHTPSLDVFAGLNDDRYLAVSGLGDSPLTMFDANTLKPLHSVTIESGLSIKGLSKSSAISATSEGFGGSAFNAGMIVMADTEQPRLVVLSREYTLNQLGAN